MYVCAYREHTAKLIVREKIINVQRKERDTFQCPREMNENGFYGNMN